MKYICLGYINEKEWESATEAEQQAMMDADIGWRHSLFTTPSIGSVTFASTFPAGISFEE